MASKGSPTKPAGVIPGEETQGNLALKLDHLKNEKEILLDELERAYEGLAQALEISRREANAAYGELRSKIAILERKVFELISLNNIGKAVTSVLKLDDLLEVILSKICELIEVDAAVVALNGSQSDMKITHVRGLPRSCVGRRFPMDVEVAYRAALKKGEPIVIPNLETEEGLLVFKLESRMRSAIAVPLKTRKEDVGMLVLNSTTLNNFTEDHVLLLSTFGAQAAIAIVNAKLYQELKQMLVGVMASFSAAIEAKDPYTEGHSSRVAEYAVSIGVKMEFKGSAMEELRNAGLIHDIGKIGVSEAIICKKGKLAVDEIEEMKLHPLYGETIAKPIPFLSAVVPGVKWHHERFDGCGYPDGIAGESIPLVARILSVADAFDAITSIRPYRGPRSPKAALKEIKKHSGSQFDPKVVAALEDAFDEIVSAGEGRWAGDEEAGKEERKADSERIVEAINEHKLS
jgi:HD-GYP domain-containing protein (c-di-GMP phosphodiesterase class II)